MSRYRFDPQSPVNEIIMRKSAGGGVRAFLFAREGLGSQEIERIKNTMDSNGWRTVAIEFDNRPCLEVRGPSNIEALETALRYGNAVKGVSTISGTDDTKFSLREKIKNNMLLTYGILTVTGDIGMLGYGYLKKRLIPGEPSHALGAGISYGAGSLMFTIFGRGDKSYHHARDISAKLREKMQMDGLAVQTGSAVDSFTKEHGNALLGKTSSFLHKHPSELGNIFTAMAGGFMARDGFESKIINGRKQRELLDGALGITTAVSGLTAALVEEKAPDPKKAPPTTIFGKAWQWLETRPNRVAGWGYMLSTVIHGGVTAKEILGAHAKYGETRVTGNGNFLTSFTNGWKNKTLAYFTYGMRGVFVSLNIIAEIILLLSSKGHGQGVKSDQSIDQTTYAIVADTIVRQPPEMQEKLIQDLSRNFLARPDVLGGEPDKIEAALRTNVKKLAANPWIRIATKPQLTEPVTAKTRSMNWQKTIASKPTTALANILS